jgi:ankyrin repeat protein
MQMKKEFERAEGCLDEDDKRFFKLFQESTFEGSQAAALEMKEIVKQLNKNHQEFLLYHSLCCLIRCDSQMLSWPNNPLLVMLQFVDPNVRLGDEDTPLQENETRATLLHHLAKLADLSDYSTHQNQVTLAKFLVEHGASVNALMSPQGETPLHSACFSGNVTNLDLVEYLLEEGANPNARDHLGRTPLMLTTKFAPGAAKFLLNWPTTDVNITSRSGESFLVKVRSTITALSDAITFPSNPDHVQDLFLLRKWLDILEMLAERDTHDTEVTTIE